MKFVYFKINLWVNRFEEKEEQSNKNQQSEGYQGHMNMVCCFLGFEREQVQKRAMFS